MGDQSRANPGNTGRDNVGEYNFGRCNSGSHNSGNNNVGKYNTGHYNTGHYNSGDRNAGNYNSGSNNAGERNAGNYNSGSRNAGDHNSGKHNAGDYNEGNNNVGYCNSGSHNSGSYNAGYGPVAYFCNFSLDDQPVFMFNRPIPAGTKPDMTYLPVIRTTEWVQPDKMTAQERATNPNCEDSGGFLRAIPYKEAWSEAWAGLTDRQRQLLLDLPNFDPEIFRDITGINVLAVPELVPQQQVVVVDGKRYAVTLTPLD